MIGQSPCVFEHWMGCLNLASATKKGLKIPVFILSPLNEYKDCKLRVRAKIQDSYYKNNLWVTGDLYLGCMADEGHKNQHSVMAFGTMKGQRPA